MIQHFFITILFIYGIKASTEPGMILYPLYEKFVILLSKAVDIRGIRTITKPLFDCTPCMASFYGGASYYLYMANPTVGGFFIWVFAMCGCNYLINRIINR